jgi:hypothetical protein
MGRMWQYGNYLDLAIGKETLQFRMIYNKVRVIKSITCQEIDRISWNPRGHYLE